MTGCRGSNAGMGAKDIDLLTDKRRKCARREAPSPFRAIGLEVEPGANVMPRLTMSASSAAPVSGAQTTVKTVAEAAAETMNEAAVETVDEATMKQNHEEAKRGPNCSSAGRACHLAAVRFRDFPVR